MNIILSFTSCVLDIYILKRFMDSVHGKIKNYVMSMFFSAALIITETLLILNMHFFQNASSELSALITSILSVVLNFILCLFYESSFKKNIYVSLIFQILVMISEQTCIFMYHILPSSFFPSTDSSAYLYAMNTLSKLFLLIYVTIIAVLISKKHKNTNNEYNFLLFITPLFSCALIILMPKNINVISDNIHFFELFILFISILNILNNYFLYKINESFNSKITNLELTNQINYQKEKYTQLSESYKTSRKIIHDIRKHYFEIQENIRTKNYDNLYIYIDSSIEDMEKTYAKYNTGNLVIDSLLTYYENIAISNHIKFNSTIDVDNNRIPIDDYSFCIILGNLLDNSIDACNAIQNNIDKIIEIKIITNNKDKFLIEVNNSYSTNINIQKKPLEHGYGIDNIKSKVHEYNGIMTIVKNDKYRVLISIPIIDVSKRVNPPILSK